MANPRIVVDVIMDALKLKRGAKESEEAVGRLDRALDKLGKGKGKTFDQLSDSATGLAKDKLGPLGDAAEGLGFDLDKMSGKTIAAGAAIAAVGAFAAQGVAKFTNLADSVRKVHDISGLTYEDSSRLVAVSDDLGISAETTAASMGRLAKNIDAGKLEEYGIQVVRTKDGAVDMAATLGNVADRMNATVDPTKKAAMGSALFGKAWADMAPVLEQGGAGIREMMASVSDGQIVTEENAQASREWSMALDDAQDAVSELQMSLAKDLLPTLGLMAKDFATVMGGMNTLKEKTGGLANAFQFLNPLTQLYSERLRHQKEQAEEAAKSMVGNASAMVASGVAAAAAGRDAQDLADAQAEAADTVQILEARQKDATEAAKDMTKAAAEQRAELDMLRGVVESVAGATLAYEDAVDANADAQEDVAEKQKAATEAINAFGDQAPEAIKAQKDYEKSVRDAEKAALGQAEAAVKQAEKLALASGQTFTAEQSNLVFRDSLAAVRDATTDPTLQGGLDNLIALTGAAAATADNAQRSYWAMEAAASAAAAVAAGISNVGTGGMAGTSADNAERVLSNQRASVTLEIDKKVLGTVMLPTLRDLERQRR